MGYWNAFLRDNGLATTAGSVVAGIWRRMHNMVLAGALPGRPRLRIHPSGQLLGLRYITIGDKFTAGRGLWLEAVTVNDGVVFRPAITIGDNVIVNENVHIAAVDRVAIGNDVLIASRVFISDHNHGVYGGDGHSSPDVPPRLRALTIAQPVTIGDRVWIGEMVSILPGVTIGAGSIIGAGSVVSRNVPPDAIAVGSPARVVKIFDRAQQQWVSV